MRRHHQPSSQRPPKRFRTFATPRPNAHKLRLTRYVSRPFLWQTQAKQGSTWLVQHGEGKLGVSGGNQECVRGTRGKEGGGSLGEVRDRSALSRCATVAEERYG